LHGFSDGAQVGERRADGDRLPDQVASFLNPATD
jgi:hypothetical protein